MFQVKSGGLALSFSVFTSGMAYGFTNILVKLIYRHFLKYWLSVSVKVRNDILSAIGYQLWPNIGSKYWQYFSEFSPIYR